LKTIDSNTTFENFARNNLKSHQYQSVMLLKTPLLYHSHTGSIDFHQFLKHTSFFAVNKVGDACKMFTI